MYKSNFHVSNHRRFLRSNAQESQSTQGNGQGAAPNYLHQLLSEVASRKKDPYEFNYLGILRSTDPLVREKGKAAKELYDDLMRDGKVYSCMEKRSTTLISRAWQITPIEETELGKQHAEIISNMLKRVRFDQVCKGLLDALMIGMSVAEIVWAERDGWLVPDRIINRAQNRFIYKEVDEYNPPEIRLLTRNNLLEGEKLPDHKFIVHRAGIYDDNPYGQGIGLYIYWAVFFKRASMVSWNKLNDRYGTPTAWGRYAPNASQNQQALMLEALRALSSDGVIVTPDDASIELIEAAMSGNITSHQTLCAYMDNWIAAVIVGENSRESNGGALAAASKERRDILLDLVQSDADLLNDTLNETLLKWICEYNGFEPCQISRPIQEEEDQRHIAETFNIVRGMGYKPSLSMIREKFGEGWEEDPEALNSMSQSPFGSQFSSPLNFSEKEKAQAATEETEADLVDNTAEALTPAQFDEAMSGIMQPLLQAIEESDSFEEALAALKNKLPKANTKKLEAMLAQAMFGAGVLGRGVEKTDQIAKAKNE